MATDLHSPTPEDLMEYLDGEGAPAARAEIDAHLTACAACQALVDDQRQLSRQAQSWTVEAAPASLRAPAAARPGWFQPAAWMARPQAAMVTLSAAAAVVVVISLSVANVRRAMAPAAPERMATMTIPGHVEGPVDRVAGRGGGQRQNGRASEPQGAVGSVLGGLAGSPAPPPPAAAPSTQPRTAAVIRTATLSLVTRDIAAIRAKVESSVTVSGGFIEQMSVTGDAATARQLHAVLRVPGDALPAMLAHLREFGQAVEDTQGAQDVTDQIVDVDARLANARATEKRLSDILQNRTGKLSDVLEVEQEVARVRLDIERLDAEKTNMNRRVAYATIDLRVSEERKAGLDPGPLALGTQLRVAAADGLQNLVDMLVGLMLFALRAGPTLLLWLLLLTTAWVVVKRARTIRKSA